jgi:hypothetical protein
MIRVVWLVRLRHAGFEFLAGSEAVEIDGEEYCATAEVSFEESMSLGSLEPPQWGAIVRMLVEADLLALRRAGHDWAHARADVSLVILQGSTVLDHQRLLVNLALSGVEYGDPGDAPGAVRFSLRSELVDHSRLATTVLSITAWPELGDETLRDMQGKVAPLVFGRPGLLRGALGDSYVGAVPAYPVAWNLGPLASRLVLAGHRLVDTDVWVTDGKGKWESFAVEHVVDGAGVAVATVDLSGASTILTDVGVQHHWSTEQISGPGSLPIDCAWPGLGSIATAILLRSDLAVDLARNERGRRYLDRQIEVGGCCADPKGSALAVAQELLKLWPTTLRRSSDGIWLDPHDPTAPPVARLWLGDGVVQIGAVQVDDVQAPREVVVRWGRDANQDTLVYVARISIAPAAGEASVEQLGAAVDAPVVEVEAPMIWDSASAWRAATGLLLQHPRVRERFELEAPASAWALGLGDLVLLVCEDGAELPGRIMRRRWAGGSWLLSLVVEER